MLIKTATLFKKYTYKNSIFNETSVYNTKFQSYSFIWTV